MSRVVGRGRGPDESKTGTKQIKQGQGNKTGTKHAPKKSLPVFAVCPVGAVGGIEEELEFVQLLQSERCVAEPDEEGARQQAPHASRERRLVDGGS